MGNTGCLGPKKKTQKPTGTQQISINPNSGAQSKRSQVFKRIGSTSTGCNDLEINNQESKNRRDSILQIKIPQIMDVVYSSSSILKRQIEIFQSEGLSLDHYKNFTKAHMRDEDNKIVSKDIYTAVCLCLFELLIKSEQKLKKVQQKVVFYTEFPQLRVQASQISDQYGLIEAPNQIIKLFLCCMIKLQSCSVADIMESYTVIQCVLERIVLAYTIDRHSDDRQKINEDYLNSNFTQEFIVRVIDSFQIKWQYRDQGRKLHLEEGEYQYMISIGENTCTGTLQKL